ncbi:hypothetical protein AVEN_131973-1 [Araneus ventricosus]|uniref:Uncharacterized protein n=1 Tax=Araneus ventricosus TaxID=182803 RepID=A0A4Y2B1P0_ARAVE|nr:hypothetical protein AVEN_131973-1 [Araneus ventricosus]
MSFYAEVGSSGYFEWHVRKTKACNYCHVKLHEITRLALVGRIYEVRFGYRPYKTLLVWRQTNDCSIGTHYRTFGSAVEAVCRPSNGTSDIRTEQALVNTTGGLILPRHDLLTCLFTSLDVCGIALLGSKIGHVTHCGL